jgi:AmmeMemoRadiSam system protein B/AmmeMemoRadiSam system protein A
MRITAGTLVTSFCFSLSFLLGMNILPLEGKEIANPNKEAPMKKRESPNQSIRPPAVAGAFYSADPDVPSAQIKDFLANDPSKTLPGTIAALIAPHAGYIYSGQVAAYAYKLIEGKSYDTVVVIAPSHRYPLRGASVYPQGAYQIPLGRIPIDGDSAEKLIKGSELVSYVSHAHAEEHSLEVQLPFLKTVLGDFKLLPVVMGSYDLTTCKALAEALYQVIKDKSVLIVASTDLSHYHPYQKAVELDQIVIDSIKQFDPEGLFHAIASDRCEACGAGPMVTTMLLAQKLGATQSEILNYANSGDVSGDNSHVVGYMSAVFYTEAHSGKTTKAGIDLGLTDGEKDILHTIARTAIESKCLGHTYPALNIPTKTLHEKRGAFVTLHKKGNLRGCIGYIRPQKPLHQTIREMALAAAFQDSRFKPVTKNELKDLEIEISVLTPLTKISSIDEIEVGKHGIFIMKDFHSGILLPQVATENNWDRETFLENTCTKAGLPDTAWKNKKTEIYIFSADIF